MTKSHNINLSITNNTNEILSYAGNWFQTGGLADGQNWPVSIAPFTTANISCCESSFSILGCSGWVQYTIRGNPLYLSFSNPVAGSNGIDIGNQTSVWDDMDGHYFPISRAFPLANDPWLTTNICSSAGDTNQASWVLSLCDVYTIIESNMQMQNVQQIHANFPTTGTRSYYKCSDAPTGLIGIAKSHFKGMSFLYNKLIMTHTNLLTTETDGKYLIADKISSGNQGAVEGTFKTLHEGWNHPCSSQACGSFMAMGIQATEKGPGASVSEIQILDIRMALANQPVTLLGRIPRANDGVNGVAMTKEIGVDGKYIIAAVNGGNLSIYRSESSALITNGSPTVAFTEIMSTTSFQDSGAGLALVTQKDGAIFLFALNADDQGQNNQMNLYQINLQTSPPTCTQIATKNMDIPGMSDSVTLLEEYALVVPAAAILLKAVGEKFLNSSFRWGKGLAITSADTIEVYASDRNTLSLSSIPAVGSDKDFGIVKWANSTPANNVLPLNTPLNAGQSIVSNNGQYFAIMQSDGNLCVYCGTPSNQGQYKWGSQATAGGGVFFTIVQADGNLCTYSGTHEQQGAYLWGSQALADGGEFFLIMQDDGNLCVYKGAGINNQGAFVWGWMNN